MKQIKTIRVPIQHAENFDKEVNEAIAEGWQLARREVLGPIATNIGVPNVYVALYAELWREVITEAERCCENCAHFDTPSDWEPCRDCSEDCDKWEQLV